MKRRSIIKELLLGTSILGIGGALWSIGLKGANANQLCLRPPGAVDSKQFLQSCLKCGKCLEACPYDILQLATTKDGKGIGTPFFVARTNPCQLCEDVPCVEVCPSGTLSKERLLSSDNEISVNNSKMGLAVIHAETCIAHWGIQCDVCYRACPKIDEAITLKYEQNTVTNRHANLVPIVNSNECTGCGICENVCVVEKAAIKVLPIEIAEGKVSNHYIKSWQEGDEARIDSTLNSKAGTEGNAQSLDYLNNESELFD